MSEKTILIDETLDFNKSKQYWMSILINKSGLSFVILDAVAQKVIAHKYVKLAKADNQKERCYFVNKVFETDEFLTYDYEKYFVVYQGLKSVSIPEDLYSEEYKSKFFELNTELSSNETILTNRLQQMNARKLFAIPSCLLDLLQNHFPTAKIYHQTTAIIQAALRDKALNKVYLSLNSEFFDIQIFDNTKLILDNAFKYKTKEDLLYYLLYTFEQLGLDPKSKHIRLFLDLDENNEKETFLKKYFAEISLSALPKRFNYSYLFTKESLYFLASQISVFECE